MKLTVLHTGTSHLCNSCVFFSERNWLVSRVQPSTKGMRLAEFHQYLISNDLRGGRLTMPDALQLAKSVLPTAVTVRDVDGELYPCF